MTPSEPAADFDRIIQQLAAVHFHHQEQLDAGLVSPAEAKAYDAQRAEIIAQLDELRGTADVTYSQFRAAFEAGAGCDVLYQLRNAMHPKDPLKEAAGDDLRSVGCYSPRAIRDDGQ